tara:strand:- start:222 stop:578 length:357 start_codon:yes stop_codon:yes gene_type:complete
MKFTLPLPPNRGNARWHWRTEKRKKDSWFVHADLLYKPSKKPPMAKAKISAKLYTYNKMDVDNLFARLKWPLDWLTRRGYIVDDDPDVLDWQGIPKQAVDRKNQRLEIQLEEITDEEA